MTTNIPTEPVYRIGTVSRLTGIATVTLRMWERRYTVVEPDRSRGRNRLYTREDIARLTLIKRLVDEGNAISTIANLSLEQLQERIQLHSEPTEIRNCRVVVLGDTLPARISRYSAELQGIDVVAVYHDRQRCETEAGAMRPEVIVVEYPTIHEDSASELMRLLARSGARRAVLVYGFGRHDTVCQLDGVRITVLRAPVELPELRRACLGWEYNEASPTHFEPLPLLNEQEIPPRRYQNDVLARLTASLSAIYCECPRHLADLLFALTAFEKYSQECVSRSPDDAALHAYLHLNTARARALMEEALSRVIESENVRLNISG